MSTKSPLKLTGSEGMQVPESFEGGVPDTLSFLEKQFALTLSLAVVGEEPVEIKAVS